MRILVTDGAGFVGSHRPARRAASASPGTPPELARHELVRDDDVRVAGLLPEGDGVSHQALMVGHASISPRRRATPRTTTSPAAVVLAAMHAAGAHRLVLAGLM